MILVYFDLETGGTDPAHPTIQLAAVAMDGATELGSFEQKIAFTEADCDPEALAMNHYDAATWVDAVEPLVAAARFAAWLRPYQSVTMTSKRTGATYTVAVLAGYNAVKFDEPRLRDLFGDRFTPWSYQVRNVLQRVLFYCDESGEAPSDFKLSTVAAWLGIAVDGAHDALVDVRLCAKVHRKIQEASSGW